MGVLGAGEKLAMYIQQTNKWAQLCEYTSTINKMGVLGGGGGELARLNVQQSKWELCEYMSTINNQRKLRVSRGYIIV